MSAATKARAEEKLHAVANKIGYPDKWRDYSTLTRYTRRCAGQRVAGGGL